MLDPNLVYFVDSDRDETVMLALEARREGGRVEFFDTAHDRVFETQHFEDLKDRVRFIAGGRRYELRKLTLELYAERVHPRLPGARVFGSTAELQDFFRSLPR